MASINSFSNNLFRKQNESQPQQNQKKLDLLQLKEKLEKQDINLEKLRLVVRDIIDEEKTKFNLPLNSQTGRLDIEEYAKRGIYSPEKVKEDKEKLQQLENKWLEEIPPTRTGIQEYLQKIITGEKIELLTMITLYKFLKDKFIVVRSTRYDDVVNGVDTVILNKNNGKIVCTLDESGSLFRQYANIKKLKSFTKNKRGGAYLKYGLILSKNYTNKNNISLKIKGGKVKNIPVFDLLVDPTELNKRLPEVSPDSSKISNLEHTLFIYFAKIINEQVKQMRDPRLGIPEIIKYSAQNFTSEIKDLYPNIFYFEDPNISKRKGKLKPEFYTWPQKITNDHERDTFREKRK